MLFNKFKKSFVKNGTTKNVADYEKIYAYKSIEREGAWRKRNENKISQYKNLMRHLVPDDFNAGDIEKFRPKIKNLV